MNPLSSWLERHIHLPDNVHRGDERIAGYLHAVGAAAAVVGGILLLRCAVERGLPLWGNTVFAASMVLLYASSAIYHLLPISTAKRFWRLMDHSSIYLLIAGTYTPICAVMGGYGGRLLFAVVWGLAAMGMAVKIVFWGRFKVLQVGFYLAMGWVALFFWRAFAAAVSQDVLFWILIGGVFYTVGVAFYAAKKLPYFHSIWHGFVMAGTFSFFWGFWRHL